MPSVFKYPLPAGMRVVKRSPDGATVTLVTTLPFEVAELLAEALEIASRLTGNDRTGAQLAAVCQEFLGTWLPQATEQRRVALARAAARQEREG